MKNRRPKTPDFTSYVTPSGLFIIFIGLIDKYNCWGLRLLSQITYTWGDIRESIDHKISKFVSPLPPVIHPQTKTFKPSHPSHTKEQGSYTHRISLGIRSYLILVPILLILCPPPIRMDCASRFSFSDHNCILTPSSQSKCWGRGTTGKLGYGDTIDRGNLTNQMSDYLPFVNVDSNVQSIQVGYWHNCVILSPSFDVKCWGRTNFGQLGYDDNQDRGDAPSEMGSYLPTINFGSGVFVSEVSSGAYHNLILTDSGQIKAWGYNFYGNLGYGDMTDRGDGANEMGNYLPFVQLGSGRTVISSRNQEHSSCVILDDLSVKCWGYNLNGQLGQGTTSSIGDGPNEMSDYLPPIKFPSEVVVSSLGTGWYHAGIISSTGSLFTWGNNGNGRLGLGHTSNIGDGGSEMGEYLEAVNVGSGRSVVQFQGGLSHSCVILDNFNVKCFGKNDQGQLGYGDTSTRGNLANQMGDYLPAVNLGSGLTAQSLHIGADHTCVELNDNSFKCFGYNDVGQLGIGNTNTKGGQANEMGDYLEPINLGTGVEIQMCFDYSPTLSPSFSAVLSDCSSRFSFRNHNCILTPSSQSKCWGEGSIGRLGYGDTSNRGDSANQMSDYLPFVNVDSNVQSIYVGESHTCVHLSPSFDVKCWGYNSRANRRWREPFYRNNFCVLSSSRAQVLYIQYISTGTNG